MRLSFLGLPQSEWATYFQEAGAQRKMLPVIMEKDFWVSWMLGVLFESPFAKDIVFKGGTSLSKVFGVIDRFSEDIDLSLSPEFLNLPEVGTTRNQANTWMEMAEAACSEAIREQLQPVLETSVTNVIGKRNPTWLEFQRELNTNSPILMFHYPTTQPPGFNYLKRSVRLEFGSLTEQRPVSQHPVRPWMADVFPNAFNDWSCDVIALDLERTFWEKATILHAEHHRPLGKPTPTRFSRHYADTAALAKHPDGMSAIGKTESRDRVVKWKSQFFASAWARYDLAVPGTFRLLPSSERVGELERDYAAMKDMYLSTPEAFSGVLETLRNLEDRINGKA